MQSSSSGTPSKQSVFIGLEQGAGGSSSGSSQAQSTTPQQSGSQVKPANDGSGTSVFVAEGPDKNSPALKNSVFMNLGPQGSAEYGENVQLSKKKILDDGGDVKVGEVKRAKVYSVKTMTTQNERDKADESMSTWASSRLEESKKQIADTSAVGEQEVITKAIIDVYMWIAACLAFAYFTGLVGTFVLQSMVAPSIAVAVAVVALPLVTLYFVRAVDDDERRMNLLYAAGLYGLFIGIVAKFHRTTFRAPPAFVIALSIAFCAKNLGTAYGKQARISLLVMSIAPAMVVYAVCGFVSGNIDVAYCSWMLIIVGVAAVDLQVKLGTMRDSILFVIFEQIQSVVAFMAVDLALTVLFESAVTE